MGEYPNNEWVTLAMADEHTRWQQFPTQFAQLEDLSETEDSWSWSHECCFDKRNVKMLDLSRIACWDLFYHAIRKTRWFCESGDDKCEHVPHGGIMLDHAISPTFTRLNLVCRTRRASRVLWSRKAKMLALLFRQCSASPLVCIHYHLTCIFIQNKCNLNQCTASQARLFSTSLALQYNRKNNASTIRVPSKKAQAAKARRKALIAAKEDSRYLKLTLEDAVSVLRVSTELSQLTYSLDCMSCNPGSGSRFPDVYLWIDRQN